jgi:hypothetical protein
VLADYMLQTAEGRRSGISQLVVDHFRCPEDTLDLTVASDRSEESGYFRFGDLICFGQCSSVVPTRSLSGAIHDTFRALKTDGSSIELPFDPTQVISNLRLERYTRLGRNGVNGFATKEAIRRLYYLARPMLPVSVRKHLQRAYFSGWEKLRFPGWPVDQTVEKILEQLMLLSMTARGLKKVPFIWFWPDGVPSSTIITHDVETSKGLKFCGQLMDLDDSFGVKSSFQIIPEGKYAVPRELLRIIQNRDFELNVHDLAHDGSLFDDRVEFFRCAIKINEHARDFGSLGFRSAVMYRNVEWYDALTLSYDMSIPNVAHLDPQRGGCCTCMPFFIGNLLELPLTATQDYSLFHILKECSIDHWKKQISLIRAKHGLISFIIHPDYITGEREKRTYTELLRYLVELRSQGHTWIALPRDVAAWWRIRSNLRVVKSDGTWRIEGEGKDRARLAYAVIGENQRLRFEIDPS